MIASFILTDCEPSKVTENELDILHRGIETIASVVKTVDNFTSITILLDICKDFNQIITQSQSELLNKHLKDIKDETIYLDQESGLIKFRKFFAISTNDLYHSMAKFLTKYGQSTSPLDKKVNQIRYFLDQKRF